MIDQRVFTAEWGILCERFNRQPSSALAARYYQSLNRRLSTEAFQEAARKVFDTCEFFPRPQDFLDAVLHSTEALAAEQWELCRLAMTGDRKAMGRMSEAGRKTVGLLGGIDKLRNSAVNEEHFRRAEFMRLFSPAVELVGDDAPRLPWTPEDSQRLRDAVPNLRLLEGGK